MTEKVSGIYKIVNKLDGKYYVGSSEDVFGSSGRWNRHQCLLREHRHHCIHLQRACDRDGLDNFDCILVESVVDATQLLVVEQTYLDIARQNPSECYNSSFDAGRITMTPEIREKIRQSNLAYYRTKTWTDADRRKMSRPGKRHPMFGKRHSVESRRKNSESNKIAQKGLNNSRADHTIRKFYNVKTGEIFEGTRYDFCVKYPMCKYNLTGLINGSGKSVRGWVLNPSLPSGQCKAETNAWTDHKVYVLENRNTKQTFVGRRFEFTRTFGFRLRPDLFTGKRNIDHGWIIRNF